MSGKFDGNQKTKGFQGDKQTVQSFNALQQSMNDRSFFFQLAFCYF